jgi:hypothetical protein
MSNNYVYFVRNPNTGEVKIGRSYNPEDRIKDIEREAGCKLEVMIVLDAPDLEKELHARFTNQRTKGEWFKPDQEMLEFILAQKFAAYNPQKPEEVLRQLGPLDLLTVDPGGCLSMGVLFSLMFMVFGFLAYQAFVATESPMGYFLAAVLVLMPVGMLANVFSNSGEAVEDSGDE